MAFHEIEKGRFGGKAKSINTVVAGVVDGASFQIAISSDILKKIGNPSALKVLIGSGENSGFLALIPKSVPVNGCYKIGKGRQININVNKVGVVKGNRPRVTVPHELTEDGLIIDIRPIRNAPLKAAA